MHLRFLSSLLAMGRGPSRDIDSGVDGDIFKDSPRLGLGLAALGRPGYINLGRAADLGIERSVADMERRTFEVLDSAYAMGIRYFDCAAGYGMSEEFLARWIESRKVPKSDIIVGTKWGYEYTADWEVTLPEGWAHEVKDLGLNNLCGQSAGSYYRLGRGGHLKLFQIHSATLAVLEDEVRGLENAPHSSRIANAIKQTNNKKFKNRIAPIYFYCHRTYLTASFG